MVDLLSQSSSSCLISKNLRCYMYGRWKVVEETCESELVAPKDQ